MVLLGFRHFLPLYHTGFPRKRIRAWATLLFLELKRGHNVQISFKLVVYEEYVEKTSEFWGFLLLKIVTIQNCLLHLNYLTYLYQHFTLCSVVKVIFSQSLLLWHIHKPFFFSFVRNIGFSHVRVPFGNRKWCNSSYCSNMDTQN